MKECPACHRCFADGLNHCPTDGDALRFLFAGEPLLDNRYQLERKIGHGGMGMVFKARHVFLKTTHAVKVILPDLVGNDPTLTTRFRQEAMAAAAIRHPHTVSVTDYGVMGGTTPYLVMEFVEGQSLHDLLTREGRLPVAHAVEIALAVCEGVAAAHRIGIVHRDLKPLNILLRGGEAPREGVKVLDFGLAKIKSGELLGSFVAAQTQGLMGSPFYMAPEQWGDEDVDVRADIYSLGVILYQMLAGDVPFAGRSIPSIMNKHLTAAPVPLSERGADVPPPVERVVRRALEKDPDRRQQTVEELMDELGAALAAVGAAGRPTTAAGAPTVPLGPHQTGAWPEGRPDTTGGQTGRDEDSIKTVAGGPDYTSGLDTPPAGSRTSTEAHTPGAQASGPQASGPQASGAQASGPQASVPHASGLAAESSSEQAPVAPFESEPGESRGTVTSRPQGGHTFPVGRPDQRPGPPAKRPGAEAPTEPLPPGAVSFGEAGAASSQDAEGHDLAGLGAQRLADEAARRAQEAAARRREAEEAERRHAAEEAERRQAAEEASRRREAEEARRRREADERAAAAQRERTTRTAEPVGHTDFAGEAVPTPHAAGAAVATPRVAGEAAAGQLGPQAPAVAPPRSPSRTPLVAAVAVVLVVALLSLGVLAYFLSTRATESPKDEEAARTESTTRPATQPATEAPAAARAEVVALPGGAFRVGRDDVPPLTDQAMRTRQRYLLWMYQQWPSRAVSVGPFAVDRTEVTNEEYAEFVRQTGHAAPPDLWDGEGRPADYQLRLPVTNVSHEDALAFAAWRSKRDGVTYRLPTEEEWEYAARGGDASRAFPWGAKWAEGHGNLGGAGLAPVGSFSPGDTPQGVSDMIGNAWELTSSEAGMYEGNDKTELDPADRGSVVVRGGSFQSRPDGDEPITATARRWVRRDFRSPALGFRLVRPGR